MSKKSSNNIFSPFHNLMITSYTNSLNYSTTSVVVSE